MPPGLVNILEFTNPLILRILRSHISQNWPLPTFEEKRWFKSEKMAFKKFLLSVRFRQVQQSNE
jgi:hypothetical protein